MEKEIVNSLNPKVTHCYKKLINPAKLKNALLKDLKSHLEHWREVAEEMTNKYILEDVDCFLCGSNDHSRVEFTVYGISYIRCPRCGLVYVNRKLPSEAMVEFYIKSANYAGAYTNDQYMYRLDNVARPRVSFINKHVRDNRKGTARWLDVGAGIGDVLVAARDIGYETIGLEISEDCLKMGREKLGADLRPVPLREFAKDASAGKFDVVSFFGYLDLIPNPIEDLECAASLLRKDGLVGILVPNFDSFSRTVQQLFPHQITRFCYPINALMQYTEKAIHYALERTGFEPLAFWWFGLDVMEFTNNLRLGIPGFANSQAEEMLVKNFNGLQEVFNKKKNCEDMLVVARRR